MELLRQKCKGLLAAERDDFSRQLNDLKGEARAREKKLHMENRRLADERVSEEGSFKEILGQQEEEYEDELRQLIAAAENELVNERETITKLRTLVQMKNTKVDQLKKKLMELSNIFRARQGVLDAERKVGSYSDPYPSYIADSCIISATLSITYLSYPPSRPPIPMYTT